MPSPDRRTAGAAGRAAARSDASAPDQRSSGAVQYSVVEARALEAPPGSSALVDYMLDAIEEHSPLPKGRAKAAGKAVLELWKELTSERSSRATDYIGEPSKLSAYLRYFLPWNVVRLVPILAGLELGLNEGDSVLDVGSGPLTLPIALWIARPELRCKRLRLVCVDRVRRAMEAGIATLEGLALRAGTPLAWDIELRKDSFQAFPGGGSPERHALVAAANVFNEGFWKRSGSLGERASDLEAALRERTGDGGHVLVVEPGDPRSGAMLAALREAALGRGGAVESPCPHAKACPMPGVFMSSAYRIDDDGEVGGPAPVVSAKGRVKQPWCHFVLPGGAAPERLERFSETVGLPKDRLVASWLLYRPGAGLEAEEPEAAPPADKPAPRLRLVSDSFALADGRRGRYACSAAGYTLAAGALAYYPSGTAILLDRAVRPLPRDPKSGAVVVEARARGESLNQTASTAPQESPGAAGGSRTSQPASAPRGGSARPQSAPGPRSDGRRGDDGPPMGASPHAPRPANGRGARAGGTAISGKRLPSSPRGAAGGGYSRRDSPARDGRGASARPPRGSARGAKKPGGRKPSRRSP